MNAGDLVNLYGASLVGRYVLTERIGDWPGGLALVKGLYHDEDAPEIVLLVEQKGRDMMGVFEDEKIILIPDDFRLPDGIV